MVKNGEIIQLNIGQAGVQIANACWELYCLEHGITADGILCSNYCTPDTITDELKAFFHIGNCGRAIPRLIAADLEPTVIDEIRTGAYRHLFHPRSLISGKEDAASNFYLGYSTIGNEMIDLLLDGVRLEAEDCDRLQGFMMFRSIGGGTGSGFGDLILEGLDRDFGKRSKFEFCVFPSPKISPLIVEPYNAVLGTHFGMDCVDCSFIMDNEALYSVLAGNLNVNNPTYTNLNRIIGQVVSGITASLRFEGSLCVDLPEFQTNLIPYPRIHYPLVTYAPMVPCQKFGHERWSTSQITYDCFSPSNQLVKCDPRTGKYMSCVLLYRGNVNLVDVNNTIQSIKNGHMTNFVDWSPCGFKVGINYQPPTYVPGSDLMPTDSAVVMLSNSTAVKCGWSRLIHKYRLMYSKRAFVHHYVGAGLDEYDFTDGKENIEALICDYCEIESNFGDDHNSRAGHSRYDLDCPCPKNCH